MVGSALSAILMKKNKPEAFMKYIFGIAALSLAVPFVFHVAVPGKGMSPFTFHVAVPGKGACPVRSGLGPCRPSWENVPQSMWMMRWICLEAMFL